MMTIKHKMATTIPDLYDTLENDASFNDFIDRNVENPADWTIFVDKDTFYKDDLKFYRDIEIKYNSFLETDTIVVLYDKRINMN